MGSRSGEQSHQSAIAALLATLAEPESELRRELRVGAERLSPGDRIGDFTLLRRLGGGGMGEVFEAEQSAPRRRVAVKVLHPECLSEAGVRRLRAEATLLARSSHPGIVEVYSAGIATAPSGLPVAFMAMELVEPGIPITIAARSEELRGFERSIQLFLQLAGAVAHAHRIGIIHLDLKPTNALVGRDGAVKLIDFGLARAAEGVVPRTDCPSGATGWIGTYEYMAPEQFALAPEGCDARADVYSLGVILFELLARRRPHNLSGLSPFGIGRLLSQSIPPNLSGIRADLPRWMANVTAKCLEPIPGMRYRDAAELARDIERGLESGETGATDPHVARRAIRWTRLNSRAITLVAVSMAGTVAAIIGAMALRSSGLRLADAEGRIQAAVLRDASAAIPRGQLQLAAMYAREAKHPAWETHAIEKIASHGLIEFATASPLRFVAFANAGASLLVLNESGAWQTDLRKFDPQLAAPDSVLPRAVSARQVPGQEDMFVLRDTGARNIVYSSRIRGELCSTVAKDACPNESATMLAVLDQSRLTISSLSNHAPAVDRLFPISGGVSVAWDQDTVLVACEDGRLGRCDPATGELAWMSAPEGQTPQFRSCQVMQSKVGILRLTPSKGLERCEAGVWTAFPNDGYGPAVTAASVAPDQSRIALGLSLGSFSIVDLSTKEVLCNISAHPDPISCIAWSPDCRYLATGSSEGRVKVWPTNPNTICPRNDGTANTGRPIETISSSRDGNRLIVADGSQIRVLELRPEYSVILAAPAGPTSGVAISPLGDFAAWTIEDGLLVSSLEAPPHCVRISTDKLRGVNWTKLGLLAWTDIAIRLMDTKSGEIRWEVSLNSAAAAKPSFVRASETTAVFMSQEQDRIGLAIDLESGSVVASLPRSTTDRTNVTSLDFSVRRNRWYWFDEFGVAHASPEVSKAGEGLRNLETPAGVAAFFTQDEGRLLAVSELGHVYVLIPETLELTAWLEAPPLAARWAMLAEESDVLTIAAPNGQLRQYNAPSAIRQPPLHLAAGLQFGETPVPARRRCEVIAVAGQHGRSDGDDDRRGRLLDRGRGRPDGRGRRSARHLGSRSARWILACDPQQGGTPLARAALRVHTHTPLHASRPRNVLSNLEIPVFGRQCLSIRLKRPPACRLTGGAFARPKTGSVSACAGFRGPRPVVAGRPIPRRPRSGRCPDHAPPARSPPPSTAAAARLTSSTGHPSPVLACPSSTLVHPR